jgi:malate permease and related proteins
MHIINTLVPVFCIIAIGAGLRRIGFMSAEFQRDLTQAAYWVGLPALLLVKIAEAPQLSEAGPALIILLVGALVLTGLGAAVCWLLKLDGWRWGTFIQASFRGNTAFIGLPVVIYAFADSPGTIAERAESIAVLTLGPLIILYNILSVLVLLLSRHRVTRAGLLKVGKGLITNPLLIACVAGGLLAEFKVDLPESLSRTCLTLGQFALPAALLSIGGTLVTTKLGHNLTRASVAMVLKTVAGPALALLGAWLLGADAEQTAVAAIMMGVPTAVASFVLADQFEGDVPLAASTVVISTIASAATLAGVLAIVAG